MLKSWSVENFKAIVNSGDLQLAPVTVLAGLNSSGKSSLLQSILMISQTLSSRVLDRALLPNGPIVQLGTFEDILNDTTESRILIIRFNLEISKGSIIPSSLRKIAIGSRRSSISTSLKFAEVTVHFRSVSDNNNSNSAIEASQVFVEHVAIRILLNNYDSSFYEDEDLLWEQEEIGAEINVSLNVERASNDSRFA